jgi:hypothetical protein
LVLPKAANQFGQIDLQEEHSWQIETTNFSTTKCRQKT